MCLLRFLERFRLFMKDIIFKLFYTITFLGVMTLIYKSDEPSGNYFYDIGLSFIFTCMFMSIPLAIYLVIKHRDEL